MIADPAISNLVFFLFVAAPVGVLAYMFWQFWTRGREPERDSISVQYEPPDGLSPGECGALATGTAALRDITATIADLSVRGYLGIERADESDPASQHKGYVFHLTKPASDWKKLRAHEGKVLTCIFVATNPIAILSQALANVQSGAVKVNPLLAAAFSHVQAEAEQANEQYRSISGTEEGLRIKVDLSKLQNNFSLQLPTLRDSIFDELVARGYYDRRPDRVRLLYVAKGIGLGALMAFIGHIIAPLTGTPPVELTVVGWLTGAIVLGFGWLLPARTSKGMRTLAMVLGFREFLERVEKDQIERIEKSPELFEKYLPYAMALGVETMWTREFARISVPQTKGGGDFLPLGFANDLAAVTK
jgi:hypothetical protein